jgi:hypothetical protein
LFRGVGIYVKTKIYGVLLYKQMECIYGKGAESLIKDTSIGAINNFAGIVIKTDCTKGSFKLTFDTV